MLTFFVKTGDTLLGKTWWWLTTSVNLLLYLLRLGFEPIFVKQIHRIHSKSMGAALVGIQPKVTLYSLLGPEYGGQTKDGGEGSKIRDWRRVKTSTARKLRPLPTSDEEQVPGTTKPNSAVCLQYTFLSSWQCPTSSSAGIKEKSPPALRAELHPSDRNGLHLVESLVKGGSIDLTLDITGFARATDGKAVLLKMTHYVTKRGQTELVPN